MFIGKSDQFLLPGKICNAAHRFQKMNRILQETEYIRREQINPIFLKKMVVNLFMVESHLPQFQNRNHKLSFRTPAER